MTSAKAFSYVNTSSVSFATDDSMDYLAGAYAKAALLMLTAVSAHYSLTPPHSAKPKTVVTRATSLFERGVLWITFCSKTLAGIMAVADTMVILVHAHSLASASASSVSPLSLTPSDTLRLDPLLSPSLLMVIGALSVTVGCLLRRWCFRLLGALFTFEITIQNGHSLVTSGPYSIVRHPSYTGIFLTLLGSTAVAFAPGAYLREEWLAEWLSVFSRHAGESGITENFGFSLTVPVLLAWLAQIVTCGFVALWFVTMTYALRSTIRRLDIEDEELHRTFGKDWEAWARKVQWKLVPGVY